MSLESPSPSCFIILYPYRTLELFKFKGRGLKERNMTDSNTFFIYRIYILLLSKYIHTKYKHVSILRRILKIWGRWDICPKKFYLACKVRNRHFFAKRIWCKLHGSPSFENTKVCEKLWAICITIGRKWLLDITTSKWDPPTTYPLEEHDA